MRSFDSNRTLRASGAGRAVITVIVAAVTAVTLHSQSTSPSALFQQAVRRENLLRQELDAVQAGAAGGILLERIRVLVVSYEDLARLFTSNDTTDDALSHGGLLAFDAYAKFGEAPDREAALRLLKSLSARFPTSPLTRDASARVKALESQSEPDRATTPTPPDTDAAATASPAPPAAAPSGPVTLREIRREVLPEALRVVLELDREVTYHDERIDGPPRVYVDLYNTRAAESLKDATIPFPDGLVRQVRVGRQLNSRTRVVLDLNGAGSHSVYALYNPFRIIIDLQRANPAERITTSAAASAAPPAAPAERRPSPAVPPKNANGSFSLARQLGLGIIRVVIDPGHGGHDPGARVNGISEAALVLDVATRLEALLKKQSFEVVLTRRTNEYVALDERTALANRSEADLFLSIHANASTAPSARGVETYFLNFASNPEAEAIAARENAGSSRPMRHLPDIVQAIAMNNKIDESRDFATIVQSALYGGLRTTNKAVKNLGVKQAPFMVLVGAQMPSVLAEVSFMSNRAEAALLKTERYKQQIAESLMTGIVRYQNSLKRRTPPRAE